MVRFSRLAWVGASVVAVAAGLSSPVAAQESNADIIVTARRVEERLQDVPISISVVSQTQIADRNITNASELSNYVPSLSTDQRYGGSTTTFNIRGYYQEAASAPTVGVYFADAISPRGNSITNTASGDGVGAGNLFDLQNVQVLKGPQGTLFGRNTTGGAVLLVPKKPTGNFEGYIEGSAGDYGMDRQQAVVNIPLGDTARLRLGGDRMQRDGYQRNLTSVGPSRFGSTDYFALRGSLVVDLTPNLENYTIVSYAKDNAVQPLNSIVACDNRTPLSNTGVWQLQQSFGFCNAYQARRAAGGLYSVQNSLAGPSEQKNEQWQIINTTTWKATDALTIKNIAAYGQLQTYFRGSIFGENFVINPATVNPADPNAVALTALATKYAGTAFTIAESTFGTTGPSASQRTFSDELQFQGSALDDKLDWQAGLYFESSDPIRTSRSEGVSSAACSDSGLVPKCGDFYREFVAIKVGFPAVFIPPVATISTSYARIFYRDVGAYAQGSYKLTDRLSVTAGIRYSKDIVHADSGLLNRKLFPIDGTYGGPTTSSCQIAKDPYSGAATDPLKGCQIFAYKRSQKPTWLIDLEYKPIGDILLYAKWTRGYRQGGVQPRSLKQDYEPESIDAYEVGTKASFRSGDVSGTFNLSGFYNDLKNQQLQASYTVGPTGATFYQTLLNIGKSRVYGVEADADLHAGIFGFNAAASYLNTKITQSPTKTALEALLAGIANDVVTVQSYPTQGQALPLAPTWRVVLTPSINLPIPDSFGKLNVSGTMVYTSESFVVSADGYDGPNSSPNHNEAVTLFNANINWRGVAGSPIDLSAFVTNLTNKGYYAAFLGGWGNTRTAIGSETGRPGMPRMWGVRLRYNFGG